MSKIGGAAVLFVICFVMLLCLKQIAPSIVVVSWLSTLCMWLLVLIVTGMYFMAREVK